MLLLTCKIIKYLMKPPTRFIEDKDLFILGCITGLRFSNFSHIKAEDIRSGMFKPEYAGQLHFYLNLLDEQPNIGIVLCKEKNNAVVEYSVKTIEKATSVATFETSHEVPKGMKKYCLKPMN